MSKAWCTLPVLLAAFFPVACQKGSSTTGPSPVPPANSAIYYTAIGASDAIGIGSSVECLPYVDCPNGRGYVQVVARELKARGHGVTVNNLGIPTAVISRTFQSLGAQYGRFIAGNFIDQEAPFVHPDTTLVTIFAGGNDVNTVTSALGGGAGAADQAGYINSQIKAFGEDFSTLLKVVRSRASSTRIVVLNLPNMAGMPFLTSATTPHRQAAQMLSVGITKTVINPLVAEGVLIVDLMCDARSYQTSTYSSDGFHPSDTGYAWIAAEVLGAATSSYRVPSGSCAHMTIVP